jgi:putative PIN family toxin of toxin-antitoxin system
VSEVVVFDTNVLLSALLTPGGTSFRCLALARGGELQSVTCREILDEFGEKLRTKFGYSEGEAAAAANEVRKFSQVVEISGALRAVPNDPDDDKFLECAILGGAKHVITGDKKHLLKMQSYRGINILSPADFLAKALHEEL